MKAQRTIITHFYNEEYLLPWWLNHHKKYFDHGILIDYHSTDRSAEIIRDICPTWQIFKSINPDFQAHACDREVMIYEDQLSGWKIALNVTEFLVGDLNKLMHHDPVATQYLIPGLAFFDWNPDGVLNQEVELWKQIKNGIPYTSHFWFRRSRSLHNFKVDYSAVGSGRHYESYNNTDALIFHYGNSISSKQMLDRRLQIQHTIPLHDKLAGHGWHHHNHGKGFDLQSLQEYNISQGHMIEDCSSVVELYTSQI